MRIALLADIHGNLLALEAVLADIARRGGVDAYWVLGDLVALGPDPIRVLERLLALPKACFVRGNTDRYVTTGDRPPPSARDVEADLSLLPVYAEVAGCFAWTAGAVTATGWLPFLDALPLERDFDLPDGTSVLAVHASPGTDDNPGVQPDLPPATLQALFQDCTADLVLVGHTHWPLDLQVGPTRVINPGSVSNPVVPGLQAGYAMLEARRDGYSVQHCRVDYDREAVIDRLREVRHPALPFVARILRGEFVRAGWGVPVVYREG